MSDWLYCNDNHYANTIELIIEPDQDTIQEGDDTSANGFRLQCTDGIKLYADNDGIWGSLIFTKYCNNSELISGFRSKVQDPCGDSCDDAALNSISGYCTDNSKLILNPDSLYGAWGKSVYCPSNSAVCGFRQQVEDPGNSDETALNAVQLACCYYSGLCLFYDTFDVFNCSFTKIIMNFTQDISIRTSHQCQLE